MNNKFSINSILYDDHRVGGGGDVNVPTTVKAAAEQPLKNSSNSNNDEVVSLLSYFLEFV